MPAVPLPSFKTMLSSWNLGASVLMAALFFLLTMAAGAHGQVSILNGSGAGLGNTAGSGVAEWNYRLHAGETLEEVADQLLTPGYNSQQLAQHNRIRAPALLGEGDLVAIPMNWLKRQPEPATVTAVSGQAQVRRNGSGRIEPLHVPTLLQAGDQIVTQAGNATVKLGNGSVIRVHPHSQLFFDRLTQFGKTGMVDTRLRLQRGKASTEVTPLVEGGSRYEIETPSAVAAVRGTRFSLKSRAGSSRLRVIEGTVAFGRRGRMRLINEGFSAELKSGNGSQIEIRQLPPAPETDSMPEQVTTMPALLNWADMGAPSHQLDIFDESTGQRVISRKVTKPPATLALLNNGRYRVQLAALTSDGLAGMPSVQTTEVDLKARAADLDIPQTGAQLDNDRPEFQWKYRGENEFGRLELAETAEFQQLLASSEWTSANSARAPRPLKPGQYHWRVTTKAGGSSIASTEPRKFIINGTLPPARIININYVNKQVRIFWENVDTAGNYLLQLAEDPEFSNIIKEATVQNTTAALRLIPGRRYFVRIKALSDGPLASRWGPARELFIE
jgi:hypothetical protein